MPVMDMESEILRSADKIRQNESENTVFKKQLDRYFDGQMPSHEVINVCSTPNILKLLDSKAKKVVLSQSDLENATTDSKTGLGHHTEGHQIEKDEIYKLSEAIRNPIVVLKGNERNKNSVVMVTELMNNRGENVFVPISLDRENGKISKIATLYGKKNLANYLEVNKGDILAVNTKKADMLADTEVQFLQSINEAVIRFDNSIAYSTQNVKYPTEKSEHEKLLPFLNAKAESYDSRLDNLSSKIHTRSEKISKNEDKIQSLSARAEKLEDTNKMLSALSGLKVVQSVIKRNEDKIEQIRSEKIPKREAKIEGHKTAITDLQKKSETVQHKLDRCVNLNTAIKSFTIRDNAERRQTFSQAMDKLHESTIACVRDKRNSISEKRDAVVAQYEKMSDSKKADVQKDIDRLNVRLERLDAKIEKLSAQRTPLVNQSDVQLVAAIKRSSAEAVKQMGNADMSITSLAESMCYAASGQTPPEAVRSEQENYLKNAEMAMEDDYNSIDGIINNGAKEPPKEQQAEKQVSETERTDAQSRTVNPDYYKSLPKSERLILAFPKEIGEKVMDELSRQNVPFSAVRRGSDAVAISVAKVNETALRTAESLSERKQATEYINSDYYKSLPKSERFTQRMTESDARETSKQLTEKGIEHSAVLGGSKSAVTVSIKDEQKARPFFSNKQRQKVAQQIREQSRTAPQKKKEQEIG